MDLSPQWFRANTLPRVDGRSLTVEHFIEEFEKRSRPVIIEHSTEHWPAMKSWDRQSLTETVGDVAFQSGPCDMRLKDFFDYAHNNIDDVPIFIFCKEFPHRAPKLLQDYDVPSVFKGRDLFDLLGSNRPDNRWILIGNRRTASKWHIDPNKTCAWNAVIRGRKRWLMLPPGCVPPGVKTTADGGDVTQPVSLVDWFSNYYTKLRQMVAQNPSWELLEGDCGPGECVFVPTGWWHCVLNLEDDTIAITQNYASETHVHSIRRFLREKADQITGTEDKLTLADRFDAALAGRRPDLLTAVEIPKEGFSFWHHLRSTGLALSFGAEASPTTTPLQEDLAQGPAAKRRRSEDVDSASDWLSSL